MVGKSQMEKDGNPPFVMGKLWNSSTILNGKTIEHHDFEWEKLWETNGDLNGFTMV